MTIKQYAMSPHMPIKADKKTGQKSGTSNAPTGV
jgi:hypothetical protein